MNMKDINVRFVSGREATVKYGTDILTILEEHNQLDINDYPVRNNFV